jgi:GAF domain-containing protein/anti-sigma regulatory factor (Ser/Thr protein kinase)
MRFTAPLAWLGRRLKGSESLGPSVLGAGMRIDRRLALLVLCTLLPLVAVTVFIVSERSRHVREAHEDGLLDTANALRVAIDREIASVVASLTVLAASSTLDQPDLRTFYAEAQRVQHATDLWISVSLIDLDGQQLVNLAVTFGTPLPRIVANVSSEQVRATRMPVVSNLFFGKVLQRHVSVVEIPVMRDGTLRYTLAAVMSPERIQRLVLERPQIVGGLTTVFDGAGRIVARTRGGPELVGQPISKTLAAAVASPKADGVFRGPTTDGDSMYAAFSRSQTSPWVVAVAVPAAPIDAAARRSFILVGGVGLALLVAGATAAAALGARTVQRYARERAEGEAQLIERSRRLEALRSVTTEITREHDLERVLGLVVWHAIDLAGAMAGRVWLVDDKTGTLYPTPRINAPDRKVDVRLSPGEGVVGLVAQRRRGMVVNDYRTSPLALRRVLEEAQVTAIAAEPLVYRDQLLGVIVVTQLAKGREFSAAQNTTLALFAGHAAIAIANARLYAEAERRREVAEAIAEATRTLALSIDLGGVGGRLLETVGVLFGARLVGLRLIEADGALRAVAWAGLPDAVFPHGHRQAAHTGLIGRAIESGRVVWSADVLSEEDLRLDDDLRLRIEASGHRAVLAVPLVTQGRAIGAMTIAHDTVRAFSADEVQLAEVFGEHAALAIQRATLFTESESRRHTLEALAQVTKAIGASLELDDILKVVGDAARTLFRSDSAKIAVRESGSDAMTFRYAIGNLYGGYDGVRIEPGKGMGGYVIATGRPVRTAQRATDPRFTPDHVGVSLADRSLAELVVPIIGGGRVEGLIYASRRSPLPFTDEDEAILVSLADHAAVAIANSTLYENARRATDDLAMLSRRLLEAQETERRTIARELHDEIGQNLTALKINLQSMGRGGAARDVARVADSVEIVSELIGHVHDLSLDLRPSVLDDWGLEAAVRSYAEQQTARAGVRLELVSSLGEARFEAQTETVAFRVVQEAVVNVIKHAQAVTLRVELTCAADALAFTIADDGVGFDVVAAREAARRGASLGLLGMEERVRLADGVLDVFSAPGQGTRVVARLPLGSDS